jgi:hypothetical protein
VSAQERIEWLGIILGSALAVLVLSYWVFAPLLGMWNGARFIKEAGPLAEAEKNAWQEYRSTGIFPGVDEELLGLAGWENALAVPAERPFARKAVDRG